MTALSRSKKAAARLLLTGLRIGRPGGLDRCPVGDARRRQRRSTGPVACGSGSTPPESDLSETTPATPPAGVVRVYTCRSLLHSPPLGRGRIPRATGRCVHAPRLEDPC